VRALLASPLGLLIGLSLGALGGGGSILAVPSLVYAAGQSVKGATTTSLILVAITAVIGIVPQWRSGRVRAVPGTVFGLAGIGGSLLGSHWNSSVDGDVLLLAFSGVMIAAGVAMVRRMRRRNEPSKEQPSTRGRIDPVQVIKVIVAGTGVGLLTGFFGVGGGFVIVPALVLSLGFTMAEAAGTSLLVITINSIVALVTRLPGGSIEWKVVIPFTLASVVGVILGGRIARTRDSSVLQRWFVGLLFAVAAYTAVKSAVAIW